MSALKDVQRSLNVIRQLSAEENAHVQQQILELMLQGSIRDSVYGFWPMRLKRVIC